MDLNDVNRTTLSIVVERTYRKPTDAPCKRIEVRAVCQDDRPVLELLVAVDDVTVAMTSGIAAFVKFPDQLLCVLVVERQIGIYAGVDENPRMGARWPRVLTRLSIQLAAVQTGAGTYPDRTG